jgi:hypothetical protein
VLSCACETKKPMAAVAARNNFLNIVVDFNY